MGQQAASDNARAEEAEEASSVRLVADARSALFRHEALNAYRRGEALSSPLAVAPLTLRALLFTLGLAVAGALGVLWFGEVEITSRGRAVMRARAGVQPLIFESVGVVREVHVQVGDVVERGQTVAELDSTALSAALLEAEAQHEAVRVHAERESRADAHSRARDKELLGQRAELTRERIDSQKASVERLTLEAESQRTLEQEGLISAEALAQRREGLAEQSRQTLLLRDELMRIEQDLAALDREQRTLSAARAERTSQAEARRGAARFSLSQTVLRASRPGRVESLMVNAGDVLSEGQVVGLLVATDKPDLVTAFVPEQDRAFVRVGDRVRLEVDQLPVGEFGRAEASIARISSEVASAAEVQHALGAAATPGVHFRIELELSRSPRTARLTSGLGSGSLMTVKLSLRRRKLIELIFDPVRKWVD